MEEDLQALLEIPVEQVVGASKRLQPTLEAPSAVSLVTRDDIQRFGYRTLADVLRSVRGFYVTDDRTYSYLGVRGFGRPGDYNTRVLLLVDGHRLNDNIYDSAQIGGEFALDLDTVKRVEVIRGPGSSLYGNNAFFAVVNVVTRDGHDLEAAEGSVELGSWESYKGVFSYGGTLGHGVELLLSGSAYDSAGRDVEVPSETAEGGAIRAGNAADAERRYHGLLKLRWQDLTLGAGYGWREKHVPTASYGTAIDDPRHVAQDARGYAELRYERAIGEDWRVSARASYDDYRYDGEYPFEDPSVPAGTVLNRDEVVGRCVGAEMVTDWLVADGFRLLAGLEYHYNLQQDQRNEDLDPPWVYIDDEYQSDELGVYLQGDVSLRTNLVLNLGLRYDVDDGVDGWSPRLGLIYSPVPEAALKLLYGRAFRSPNVFETRYGEATYLPNPNLRAETVDTYEFVYEQDLPWSLRLSSSVYYYQVDGLISQRELDAGGELQYQNAEGVEAFGLEFGLEARWAWGGVMRLGYTTQKAEVSATRELLSNCPRHLVQGSVSVPLYADRIFAGLEGQYVGDVVSESGSPVDAYAVLNVTVFTRELIPGLEASASVYNLLDEAYGHPVGLDQRATVMPQDGRSFRFKFTYRF